MTKKEHKRRHIADSRNHYAGFGFPAYVSPYSMVDNGCMNQDQFSQAQAPVDAGGTDAGVGGSNGGQ